MKLIRLLCPLSAIALTAVLVACSPKSSEKADSDHNDENTTQTTSADSSESEANATDLGATDLGTTDADGVTEVSNGELLGRLIDKPQGKPMVIDFSATWCGPCQQFKPTFHAIAQRYKDKVSFYSVDIDNCSVLADKLGIQSIPTVMYVTSGGKTSTTVGLLSENEFEQKVKALK